MLFRELIYQLIKIVLFADYTGQLIVRNLLLIMLKNATFCVSQHPSSCLRSPPPKPRTTVVASSSSRGVLPDKLDVFRQLDVLNVEDIRPYSTECENIVSFEGGNQVVVQSKDFTDGVSRFL